MPGLGIAAILIIALALLVGFTIMPAVVTIVGASVGVAVGTPLNSIIQILPYMFLGLIIIGCFWLVGTRT